MLGPCSTRTPRHLDPITRFARIEISVGVRVWSRWNGFYVAQARRNAGSGSSRHTTDIARSSIGVVARDDPEPARLSSCRIVCVCRVGPRNTHCGLDVGGGCCSTLVQLIGRQPIKPHRSNSTTGFLVHQRSPIRHWVELRAGTKKRHDRHE